MTEARNRTPRRRRTAALPSISDAEWLVMKTLWSRGPLTTNQVLEALEGPTGWKPQTVHTLLSRLVRKGALAFAKQGREYLFQPQVAVEDYEHAATQTFLGRFFGGELAPFLARFVERESLTPEQVAELKRILDGKSQ